MFEFLSENHSKGTRKYKIQHSGTKGKDEFVVNINLKNQVFLVLGKGGKGGNGFVGDFNLFLRDFNNFMITDTEETEVTEE